MSNHQRDQWTPNQPGNSSWTNNSTGSSFQTSSYQIGSTNTQGTRINTDKRLFFGSQDEFSIRYSSITSLFKIDHTDSNGNVKNVLSIDSDGSLSIHSLNVANNNIDMENVNYEYEIIQADGIRLTDVSATTLGFPNEQMPSSGKIVHTQNTTAFGKSKLYVALDTTPGGSS